MPRKKVKVPSKKSTAQSAQVPRPQPPPSPPESPAVPDESAEKQNSHFPITGFGASAGGLEAFSQVIRHLPGDTGMAFVLVQHLDPFHASSLPELLAKSTSMPVTQVKDSTPVQPDHIYVIPPNTSMTIVKGVLQLAPRDTRGHHMPIDVFFRSLAQDQTNRSVGVILSGTATDGTLGLRAIKDEGGITFAQDEGSAKYAGMPRSAVASGCVDFVLPPDAIAKELARIGRHPLVNMAGAGKAKPLVAQSEDIFQKIIALLRVNTKVDFTYYKVATLRRRIGRRMVLQKIEDLSGYLKFLQENPAEIEALYRDVLINVTSFFRDPAAFDALQQHVFPAIMKDRSPDAPIRIWVPGCSTGEEAYSIAICLLEYLADRKLANPIQLFGTDISDAAIEKARSGVYVENIALDVSPERLRRFFIKTERGYQISSAIRERCVFAVQDLTRDPPFSRLDLISCRNLLIYLGPVLQKKAVQVFHYALNANCFLLLGSAETITAYADLFTMVDKKEKIYQKRPKVRGGFEAQAPEYAYEKPELRKPVTTPWMQPDVQKEADRIVLSRYAPAGVLIDGTLHVLQFRGRTGDYLEPAPGEASLDVLKMARPGLGLELRTAIHMAVKKDAPIRKENLRVKVNGGFRSVNLEVIPLKGPGKERDFLVLFEDATPRARAQEKASARPSTARKEEASEVSRLNEELDTTRHYLQSIIEEHEATNEELKSANEEVQSTNEELQSTNEELETAKEELQSANEELTTVNEELQNRNLELTQVNNDLNNLLSSVNIPTVVLGNDLRVRRFTPLAQTVLNLIPTDIGRPIVEIKPNVEVPNLEELLWEVSRSLNTVEREVRDRDGRWYSIWIRPYRTSDNRIEGMVLALVDIDAQKRALEEAENARDYAQAIVETVREPMVVLAPDLRVTSANRSFYQNFLMEREETEGRSIYELGNACWNIPAVRGLLEEVLAKNHALPEIEVEQEFDRVGRKTVLLNARSFGQAGTPMILLAMHDITEHKQAVEARFRKLFEAAKDGIVICDAGTGRITDVNPYLIDLFGYSRVELVGRKFWETGAFQDVEAGEFAFRHLQKEEMIRFDDVRLQARDGRFFDVEVIGSAYLEGDRKVMQLNVRNVTERKMAQEAMRRSEEQLMQAQKMEAIGRLAGGVAHDFNNMLTAILGYSELLLNRMPADDPLGKEVAEIQKAGQRAAGLTRQLLAFGRKQILQPKVIDLNALISDMHNMLRQLVGENIDLEVLAESSLGYVKADPGQLQQVIVNLSVNARDAMPQGGKLTLTTANYEQDGKLAGHPSLARGRYVMLSVTDTGIGMNEDIQAHLFEPFFTTKPKGMGTGLGLSTLYGIVKQSGGTVWVHSQPGQGTTFEIYLPRVEDEATTQQPAFSSEEHKGQELILLAEDEDTVRTLIRESLRKSGYTVLEARGGEEALSLAKKHKGKIHLMLADVVMPKMSGRELAERLAPLRPETKVLYMSGHTEDVIVRQGIIEEHTNFIQKPFTPEALTRKIRRILDEEQ